MQVAINRGQSSLPEQKAVSSSVVDQKINLLVNGPCVAIQAVDEDGAAIRIKFFAAVAIQRGPVTDGFAYLCDCFGRAGGLRPFGGDIQVVVKGTFQNVNFCLKHGACLRVVSSKSPGSDCAHFREVCGRCPRVVDRHEKFIECFGDEIASVFDALHGVKSESSRDGTH